MINPVDIEALARDRQERMEQEWRKLVLYRSLLPNGNPSKWTPFRRARRVGRIGVYRFGIWLQAVGERMAGTTEPGVEIQQQSRTLIAPSLMPIPQYPDNHSTNNHTHQCMTITPN